MGDYWMMDERPTYPRTYIREWREFRQLNRSELAERVGLSVSMISMMERGERGYRQETLEKIAYSLRCTTGDLLSVNPLEESPLWSLWETLTKAERRLAMELLKAVKRSD